MSPFEQSIRAASANILSDVNLKCYQISWELFSLIVNKTPSPANDSPHAKGLLSNQWYPMLGGGLSGSKGTSTSANGSDSLSRIKAMMSAKEFLSKDGKFTLSNNLDYADTAETTGWAKTPPYRMVALSFQATLAKFSKVNI